MMATMQLGLAGKSAVVTGAASGIGRACAYALVAEGARVAVLDADGDGLALAAAEIGASTVTTADVTDEEAIAAAVDLVAERQGGIDVVVGCAGISGPFGASIEKIPVAEFTNVFAVNTTGQFLLAKHTLRHLRGSAAPAVVFIGSDSAYVAAPGMAPYCASKAAVVQLARALSVDFADEGIRFNCVCPSVVDTAMARADLGSDASAGALSGSEMPVQSPDDIATHVLYLASPRSHAVNGHAVVSDHGYSARSAFPA